MKVIGSLRSEFKLFKQPYKVGDVIEYREESFLILAIENFEIGINCIIVNYTVQNLSNQNYTENLATSYGMIGVREFEFTCKINDKRIKRLQLGRTINGPDGKYRVMEYTEISLKSTDLYFSFLARKINPVSPTKARKLAMSEKRKKLQLDVF